MEPDLAALLKDFPVTVTIPVQWGDQDAYQHVNNTVFFRWFETSRIAYWARVGLSEAARRTRVGPILAAVACDFRRQVTFPDTVHVGARVTRLGRTSFSMEHAVVGTVARAVVAEGHSTIVLFDYNANAPVPLPDDLRHSFEALEGKTL
jgi:acyl-CoA thioester hydrolase